MSRMDTDGTAEAMMAAEDVYSRLYTNTHSVACDNPDCPAADSLHGTPNMGASIRRDALLIVLLSIVDNIGESLDLLRLLMSDEDDANDMASRASSAGPQSQPEGITSGPHGPLDEPPTPRLYYDQWTQSPSVTPPEYTALCHSCLRGFPLATYPYPASQVSASTFTSDATTYSSDETASSEDQEGARYGYQEEQQHQARASNHPFLPSLRTPEVPAGMPFLHVSPAGSRVDEHQSRGRPAAWLDSDSEEGDGA